VPSCRTLTGFSAKLADARHKMCAPELLSQYSELPPPAELAALPGDEALRRQVRLVASYRRLPFRDPDLPEELLPEDWPGGRVHELFVAAHDALHGPADRFVREVIDRSYAQAYGDYPP
jgi:phenylacetic acid degradation operon negative regulatory protein